MNTIEVGSEQQALIQRLIRKAPSGWKRLFVNYEIIVNDEGPVSNCIAFALAKSFFSKIRYFNLDTGADEWQLLNMIGEHFMARTNERHITIDLIVKESGRYKFYFDYDEPQRLGGNLAATDRYKKYIDHDELLLEFEKNRAQTRM